MADAYDYTRVVATATRLIAKFGRTVEFVKFVDGAVDADNPLADSSSVPYTVPGVSAAFVYPSGVQSLGIRGEKAALFQTCEQIALVAGDGANDFLSFDILRDSDGSDWKISQTDELKPGDVSLLYYIGVNRP